MKETKRFMERQFVGGVMMFSLEAGEEPLPSHWWEIVFEYYTA